MNYFQFKLFCSLNPKFGCQLTYLDLWNNMNTFQYSAGRWYLAFKWFDDRSPMISGWKYLSNDPGYQFKTGVSGKPLLPRFYLNHTNTAQSCTHSSGGTVTGLNSKVIENTVFLNDWLNRRKVLLRNILALQDRVYTNILRPARLKSPPPPYWKS